MRFSKVFWLGLIFSLCSIAFIIGLLYLQEITFKKSNFIFTVLLDNVQGLNEGDNVNMLGKRIGRVKKTKIIGKKIAIDLAIDNSFSFRIPIDSKIEVKSEGLMGEKYVSISPGTDTKNSILAGDRVEGTRQSDFSELTPGIVPITHDLAAFSRRLRATLGEDEKTNIQQTIKNVEGLSKELQKLVTDTRNILTEVERENIKKIITNLSLISDSLKINLDTNFEKLDLILSDIQKFTNKSDEFSETISSLKMAALSFTESAASFKTTIEKIDDITENLKTTTGTLPKLLNDPSIYNNLDSLIADFRWIANDFREHPGKYIKEYIKAKKD